MTSRTTAASSAGHGLLRSLSPRPSTASLPADRRGRLRNAAKPGDFLAAPRCGAHTRAGGCCRQPAMRNGRCRLHGGLSTGPRTAEGRARCARARLKHGAYSAATRTLMAEGRAHVRRVRTLLGGRATAGHGVLRSNCKPTVGGRPSRGTGGRPHGDRPTIRPVIGVHLRSPAFAKPASGLRSRFGGVGSAGEGRSAANLSASTAGHGVLRSKSASRLSLRAVHLLAHTALRGSFSAGHGVLRSLSTPGQF